MKTQQIIKLKSYDALLNFLAAHYEVKLLVNFVDDLTVEKEYFEDLTVDSNQILS